MRMLVYVKLRTAFLRVAWSRRQSFASVGAVLSLLDGPSGCDPAFCVVWFRFRMMRRYLAYYRLLDRSSGLSWSWSCALASSECVYYWVSLGFFRVGLG